MKIAFIGSTGHAGYALKTMRARAGFTLSGVASGPNAEDVGKLAGTLAKMGHEAKVFDDYRALLDQKPDVAVVACWFCDHAEVACEALSRGIAVYMDKPVSTTWEGLARLERAQEKSGSPLAAMFGIRYEPHFLTVKSIADSGALGDIRLLHGQKSYKMGSRGENFKQRALYGGTIPWVASHAVDWVRWLSGQEFVSVAAAHSCQHNQGHGEMEVSSACLYALTGGVIATVTADYFRPANAARHDDDRVRVTGTRGMVEVVNKRVFLETDDIAGRREMPQKPEGDAFGDFVDAIQGKNKPDVSARDSFAITRAVLAARDAADTGKTVAIADVGSAV